MRQFDILSVSDNPLLVQRYSQHLGLYGSNAKINMLENSYFEDRISKLASVFVFVLDISFQPLFILSKSDKLLRRYKVLKMSDAFFYKCLIVSP